MSVLWNDERPAVRVVVTVLGGVLAALEDQFSGLRTLRMEPRECRRRGEVDVPEAEHGEPEIARATMRAGA